MVLSSSSGLFGPAFAWSAHAWHTRGLRLRVQAAEAAWPLCVLFLAVVVRDLAPTGPLCAVRCRLHFPAAVVRSALHVVVCWSRVAAVAVPCYCRHRMAHPSGLWPYFAACRLFAGFSLSGVSALSGQLRCWWTLRSLSSATAPSQILAIARTGPFLFDRVPASLLLSGGRLACSPPEPNCWCLRVRSSEVHFRSIQTISG